MLKFEDTIVASTMSITPMPEKSAHWTDMYVLLHAETVLQEELNAKNTADASPIVTLPSQSISPGGKRCTRLVVDISPSGLLPRVSKGMLAFPEIPYRAGLKPVVFQFIMMFVVMPGGSRKILVPKTVAVVFVTDSLRVTVSVKSPLFEILTVTCTRAL